MTDTKPTSSVGRRDQGLALADALLQSNRELQPLPAAAHDRVKRRLRTHVFNRPIRRAHWLRPVVIAGSLLLWGTAFGIAIDQFVVQRRLSEGPQMEPAAVPDSPRARRPKARTRPAKKIAVEDNQAPPPVEAVPQEVAAPVVEPASPTPSAAATTLLPIAAPAPSEPASPTPSETATTLALLAKPARPQISHLPRPAPRPAPAVALMEPATAISPPAAAAIVDREYPHATNSSARAALPALLPGAPAPAATALATPAPPSGPAAQTVAAADSLTEERLLVPAVRSLRAQRDAPSALAALDAYRTRYPQGRLSVEASILRVDALTALGRQPEALRTLEELDLGRVPGGVERRLQRGELRAASGHFRKALADFDWVLAHVRKPDSIERALGGRTQCRQHLGDLAGAHSDALEYLRRFPAGPFARQAGDIAQVNPKTAGP